jgi:hypothetical protein
MRKSNRKWNPRWGKESGNQMIEFTLIGLPLTFLLFSISNMCFAMLTLHTLQEAVEQAARYVSTRGSTCSSGSNTCTATIQQIVTVVANNSPGISRTKLNVTLTSAFGTQISCTPVSTCLAGTCSPACSTVWPTSANGDNAPGKDFIVSANSSVLGPMFMFWDGASNSTRINSSAFAANSRQRLMF